VRQDVVLRRLA